MTDASLLQAGLVQKCFLLGVEVGILACRTGFLRFSGERRQARHARREGPFFCAPAVVRDSRLPPVASVPLARDFRVGAY